MRRFFRVLLILLAALAIVGLASGAFKPGNRAAGGSSGGAESPSTTAEPTRISCYVEQGEYGNLLPEVWENGHKLSPVDEIEDDGYTFDVYEIIPGVSEIRFKSTVPTKEATLPSKGGDSKAGSGWYIVFYDVDSTYHDTVYSVCTVFVPSGCLSIEVGQTHL